MPRQRCGELGDSGQVLAEYAKPLLFHVHVFLSGEEMLELTGNFTQSIGFFTSNFRAVSDEFFAHRLVRHFGAANMNHDGYGHVGSYFVAAPVHGGNNAVRNVACFIIKQGNFVCEAVNHEAASFWYSAAVSHSHFDDEGVTGIGGGFTLMHHKVLGVKLLHDTSPKQFFAQRGEAACVWGQGNPCIF